MNCTLPPSYATWLSLLPRKKVWTHQGKKVFFYLVNQRIMATVVVTLIVASLLAIPPQVCIRKAIHNDFSGRSLLKDIPVSFLLIFHL